MTNRRTLAAAEGFWARVDQTGGPDACWPWLNARNNTGYGTLIWAGRMCVAHRVAAHLSGLVDDVVQPDRKGCGHILHQCDNRSCCNPDHFKIGTYRQNQIDAYARRRRAQPRSTHANAKLTPEQVRDMRVEYALGGTSHAKLAAKHGVHESNARNVILRRRYVDVV